MTTSPVPLHVRLVLDQFQVLDHSGPTSLQFGLRRTQSIPVHSILRKICSVILATNTLYSHVMLVSCSG